MECKLYVSKKKIITTFFVCCFHMKKVDGLFALQATFLYFRTHTELKMNTIESFPETNENTKNAYNRRREIII